MFQPKPCNQMFAQCLHAISLGSVMPSSDEGDTGLLCDMYVLF